MPGGGGMTVTEKASQACMNLSSGKCLQNETGIPSEIFLVL